MKKATDTTWYDMAPAERHATGGLTRPTWWGEPANTLDRATAMIPRLFYERLDDFGIDFALLYTSLGLFYVVESRRGAAPGRGPRGEPDERRDVPARSPTA